MLFSQQLHLFKKSLKLKSTQNNSITQCSESALSSNDRFFAINTSMSMCSSVSLALLGLQMNPDVLNTRPEAQLEAAIHRYFLAVWARWGKALSCVFHHVRGSSSALSSGMVSYNVNSFLTLHSGSSSVDAVCVSFPCCFFLSPWMLDKSPFRSVLDFFVGWVADEGHVYKLGTLWVCRRCILSTRCCFTSSFNVVKLSLKWRSRKVAVFNTSCRFLSSYLCFRSFPIFLFQLTF